MPPPPPSEESRGSMKNITSLIDNTEIKSADPDREQKKDGGDGVESNQLEHQ